MSLSCAHDVWVKGTGLLKGKGSETALWDLTRQVEGLNTKRRGGASVVSTVSFKVSRDVGGRER